MPQKRWWLLAAAAAVVLVVIWQRKQAQRAAGTRAPTYDPQPPNAAAQVANSITGLAQAGANWAAQWIGTAGENLGNLVATALPQPQTAKPKSTTNTGLVIQTSPQLYH